MDRKHKIYYVAGYIGLLFLSVIIYLYSLIQFFIYRNQIDITSAYYLLSSLAQCEAAIMAIVVSFSLVVIQLTFSSYSQRLVKHILFVKAPWFWLLCFYIISIILTLTTLRFINVYSKQYTAFWTTICCTLGVFCFFLLIPYAIAMVDLLRPGAIFDNILKEVKKTKDSTEIASILNMYFAIIIRALSQHEYVSAVEGLIKIGDVLEYFDEDSLLQIYLWIRDTIKLMKESGSEIIICESIEDVCKNIGLIAISKNYRWVNEIISLI